MIHSISISASTAVLRWRLAGRRALPPLLSLAALTAQAQTPATSSTPDPLDAQATVPALNYQSSFAQNRALSGEKVISWREANDSVARIGGWRVYAREAQQSDAAQAPASVPVARPAAPASAAAAEPTAKPASAAMPAGHGGQKTP